MTVHLCHAFECDKPVPPKMLMCLRHWRMVPKDVQDLVWAHYRSGQEIDKQPSHAYLMAQRSAVWSVWVLEGKGRWEDVPSVDSTEFLIGPSCKEKDIAANNS